jgi:hypothetical protein
MSGSNGFESSMIRSLHSSSSSPYLATALASALSLVFEGAIVQAYMESDATAGREARRAAEQLIRAQRGARRR